MSNLRDVSSVGLAPSDVDMLRNKGFRYTSDIVSMKPLELSSELSITPAHALNIIKLCKGIVSEQIEQNLTSQGISLTNSSSFSSFEGEIMTAKDLLIGIQKPIVTFVRALDEMLGGGVPLGQITEFSGVPGIGKTQMAIQLALNVQIPEAFNGCGGEAVYIDTEGSFMPERAYEMASELSNHLLKLSKVNLKKPGNSDNPSATAASNYLISQLAIAENITIKKLLSDIHYFRCHNQYELVSVINSLPNLFKGKPNIKVVVIDSIAFHFRSQVNDIVNRNRVLTSLTNKLNEVANSFKAAVVCMNHVTTKVIYQNNFSSRSMEGSVTRLVPALGDLWSHCVANRVMLHWMKNENAINRGVEEENPSYISKLSALKRMATLTKSASMPSITVEYIVSSKGVRDVPRKK